ncbi:ORFL166C.iORF3 [Human betaherpesvirus 5]|nr:ORFL166C.iORF3 [Human betaherpesvirus 5]QHX40502.1 ORFL166C.iORF3 [Human betaherpesvirus 5]
MSRTTTRLDDRMGEPLWLHAPRPAPGLFLQKRVPTQQRARGRGRRAFR